MSRHAPLSDETIWAAVTGEDESIWGCRWGDYTRFAVLDVDETSQYHNELGLARLRHTLAAVEFTGPKLYQSSTSGGWHLYLPFSDWVETATLHETLKQWLRAEGYEIRAGQLEIFPSKNGLRLPLQKGFAWLDDQGAITIRREDISADQAVAQFLDDLEACAHNWPIVQERIASRLGVIEAAAAAALRTEKQKPQEAEEDGFSAFFTNAGMIPEVYEAGRDYWAKGLTGTSQRHHAILCVGHYLWYGDEAAGVRALPGIGRADQRDAAIEAWLKEKHNGHSEAVLRGDWKEIGADIRRACNWEASDDTEPPRRPYLIQSDRAIDRQIGLTKQWGRPCYARDWEKGNIGREEEAREKIRAALIQLLEAGRRVTVRGLERLSGCRKQTIRRHADIWGAFRLSNGPGDFSFAVPALPPNPLGSCPTSIQEKKEFLDPSCPGDSGDLGAVQGSCKGELAPIVLTPPFLLPGYEPTSEPPASRPSPSGSFGSLDAGARVRWYSGRTADGAGGLGPSCNELPGRCAILPSLTGLLAVTKCYPPVNLLAHSGATGSLVQPFWVGRYEPPGFDRACLPSRIQASRSCRYRMSLTAGACIRVNSLRDKRLRILIYSDVRGPPKCIRAYHALFSDTVTSYGATGKIACRANKRHRLACLQKVPALTQSDVS